MPRYAPTTAASSFRASKQIVEWLGSDFDGAIIFDEAHAMQNAGGGKGSAAMSPPRNRDARACAFSMPCRTPVSSMSLATGATTFHLAYAQRLGLWGGEDFPFAPAPSSSEGDRSRRRRGDGGAGPRPALARSHTARSLSFDGVEYELVEHALTDDQTRIYDAYAGAFAIIHNNLDAAMEAANITGERPVR